MTSMTKYEIAKQLNVSHQAVYDWYNGKTLPSTNNLFKLSQLLNVPILTLLDQFAANKKAHKKSQTKLK
jgi:transcriptional regulator with XRE-family HTH domain